MRFLISVITSPTTSRCGAESFSPSMKSRARSVDMAHSAAMDTPSISTERLSVRSRPPSQAEHGVGCSRRASSGKRFA